MNRGGGGNPSRLSKTDPKLIDYEEAARWKFPHPEPNLIAAGPGDTLYICAGHYVTAMSREGAHGMEIAVVNLVRMTLSRSFR